MACRRAAACPRRAQQPQPHAPQVQRPACGAQAKLEVLREGRLASMDVRLVRAHKLVPVHINNRPPTYYIIAGLVFTQARPLDPALGLPGGLCGRRSLLKPCRAALSCGACMRACLACPGSAQPARVQVTVPLLRSEYGKDYDFEAPVKLLDRMMHSLPTSREQQARAPRLPCGGLRARLELSWHRALPLGRRRGKMQGRGRARHECSSGGAGLMRLRVPCAGGRAGAGAGRRLHGGLRGHRQHAGAPLEGPVGAALAASRCAASRPAHLARRRCCAATGRPS